MLTRVKDTLVMEKRSKVVYQIPCSQLRSPHYIEMRNNGLSMAAMVLSYCVKAKVSGSCFQGGAL